DPRDHAAQRLAEAKTAWGHAMTAHKMAPPDEGFAGRLRTLAGAAQAEREACEEADRAGLLWRPIPGAQGAQPPYELRPGTGRRAPHPRSAGAERRRGDDALCGPPEVNAIAPVWAAGHRTTAASGAGLRARMTRAQSGHDAAGGRVTGAVRGAEASSVAIAVPETPPAS